MNVTFKVLPAKRASFNASFGVVDGEIQRIYNYTIPNLFIAPTLFNYVKIRVFSNKKLNFAINGWESLRKYRIIAPRGIKFVENNTK